MDYVSQATHDGRCQVEDERFARDNNRLNELESLTRTLSDTNIKMGQILTRMDKDVANHSVRITAIEQKPAKRWDGVVDKLILLIVAAVAGFLLAKFGLSG